MGLSAQAVGNLTGWRYLICRGLLFDSLSGARRCLFVSLVLLSFPPFFIPFLFFFLLSPFSLFLLFPSPQSFLSSPLFFSFSFLFSPDPSSPFFSFLFSLPLISLSPFFSSVSSLLVFLFSFLFLLSFSSSSFLSFLSLFISRVTEAQFNSAYYSSICSELTSSS